MLTPVIKLIAKALNMYSIAFFITCALSWQLLLVRDGSALAWLRDVYLIMFEPPLSVIRPYLPSEGRIYVSYGDGQSFGIDLAPIPFGYLLSYISSKLEQMIRN